MAEATTGKVGHSHEGIEIWNRSWEAYKARLFPEDPDALSLFAFGKRLQLAKSGPPQYWHIPAHTTYTMEGGNSSLITVKKPIIGLRAIFAPNNTVMDVGCGGGDAAIGMARENRKSKILAVDYELGKEIAFPVHTEPNLEFQQQDWRAFTVADNSVDAFLSDQGIARYGNTDIVVNEMTRIAKVGALFRGTQTRGIYGVPNFHERLAQAGWDVWHLKGLGGPTNIIAAQLKGK